MRPITTTAVVAVCLAGGVTAAPAQTAAPAIAQAATAATGPARPGSARLVPLDVKINGVRSGTWALLDMNDQLHATDDAFQEWRIERPPAHTGFAHHGQTWYPLAAVPGFTQRIDRVEQAIDIAFSPEVFAATRMGHESPAQSPVAVAEPAVFLNIDATVSRLSGRGQGSSLDMGALTEIGLSTRWGVLTSSHVIRQEASEAGAGTRVVATRLETGFVRDFPAHHATLRLGDTLSRGGMWGRSVYFGGLQLSRNFALTPGFVTQPIPTLSGTSTTPSTVSLYVDDVLRQTSEVPPGPFTIDNLPLLTSAGQARLVVRDLLGRETVIEQAFFTHASLLEPGLDDWSVETGAVRRGLGSRDAGYGERFASGLWRRGIGPTLTLDGQAVLARSVRGWGLGATFALPWQSLGQAGVRLSDHATAGRGHEWLLGMESQHRRHGFAMRGVGASAGFRVLGTDPINAASRLELAASYHYTSETSGTTGLTWTRLRNGPFGTVSTLAASHSRRVGRDGYLSFTTSRVLSAGGAPTFGIAWSMPLEAGRSIQSSAHWRRGRADAHPTLGAACLPRAFTSISFRSPSTSPVPADHRRQAPRTARSRHWCRFRSRDG